MALATVVTGSAQMTAGSFVGRPPYVLLVNVDDTDTFFFSFSSSVTVNNGVPVAPGEKVHVPLEEEQSIWVISAGDPLLRIVTFEEWD